MIGKWRRSFVVDCAKHHGSFVNNLTSVIVVVDADITLFLMWLLFFKHNTKTNHISFSDFSFCCGVTIKLFTMF